jgi:exodeoxyribonuclease III
MRIITLNLNGIRSAASKGFFTWLEAQNADVVCLQEIKAQRHQLTDAQFNPAGWHCFYHDAQKKGYSGVALYSRKAPDTLITGLGWEYVDCEGRYLEARFGKLRVVSLYVHSGASGDERQALKFRFLADFMPYLKQLRQQNDYESIICGDWNIAHKTIDLKNWKSNQKNSGFLPKERAWMDELFSSAGFIDAFRVVNHAEDQYTWWSNRGRAWEKNVGWRLDYQVITSGLKDKVISADIYKTTRFSDHAPLTLEYQWDL